MGKSKESKKRIAGAVLAVVLIAGLLAGGVLYLRFAQAEGAMPMPFGYGLAVVMSGSMEPVLQVDDLVVIHAQDSYSVGDIIVFERDGTRIIHRVIQVEGQTIQTQGDANNAPDTPVSLSAVKGALVLRIPKAGAVVKALKTPGGICAVVAIAAALMGLSYWKEARDNRKELESQRLEAQVQSLREEMNKPNQYKSQD